MPNSKQIVYLSQAQYAELIANGSITVDGVTVTYDENDIYVTPQAEPVTDVRIAGTSVAVNGIANIPTGSATQFGVMRAGGPTFGVTANNGIIAVSGASSSQVKAGGGTYLPIVTQHQHEATFYGLAKAAGHDEASSTEPLGTYTPEAKGAIQSMLGVSDLIATAENNLVASKAYAIGDVFTANGKLYKVTAAIAANDAIVLQNEGETISGANAVETKVGEGFPHDVQVNGVSVVSGGVANVPITGTNKLGVCSVDGNYGIGSNNGRVQISAASSIGIKNGANGWGPLVPAKQHESTFYGLAKAAGSDEKNSTLPVGQYTESAKSAISTMLNAPVTVSGSTPTITALPGIQYICGEVYTLDITTPERGIVDVVFTSGSTPTVLTVTPPSGMTMKWANGFDPTALEANTTYEINIADGCLGVCGVWS